VTLEIVDYILIGIMAGGATLVGILAILLRIKDQTKKLSYLRFLIQTVSFIAIFSTLVLLAKWPSIVFGTIVILTLFFGRFFCGWICPFGLYMDLITLIRKASKLQYWNLSERVNNYLHKLRYIIVAFVLSTPFLLGALDPGIWNSFLLFYGPFKDLTILFLGPLEPIIKPGAGAIGFNGYSLSFPYIRGIMEYTSGIFLPITVLAFTAITIVSSFMVRRFWCRFCPTAVSIAAIDRFKRSKWVPLLHIHKVEEKCTKCGICKRVCPVQVTDVYDLKGGEITTSMCMLCMRCVEMCPYEDCLKVNMGGRTVFKSRNWLEPSTIE
jgi:ferredoxin-type protein NapH